LPEAFLTRRYGDCFVSVHAQSVANGNRGLRVVFDDEELRHGGIIAGECTGV
jgi:hypothetical protein